MKTLINGRDIYEAIKEEILKQITEANPEIHPEEYKDLKEVPGFLEAMRQNRFVCFDRTDEKLYRNVRQKMNRTQRLHKGAAIDLRRDADGHQTVAAVYRGEDLWEEPIGWDVYIEK